jgi:hypothetical protein
LLIVSAHIEKTIRTFVGYPGLDLFFRKLLERARRLLGHDHGSTTTRIDEGNPSK